jgi:hypothetical protein
MQGPRAIIFIQKKKQKQKQLLFCLLFKKKLADLHCIIGVNNYLLA